MNILVVGSGPLPFEKRGIVNAGGLRTEQFLSTLPPEDTVFLITIENTPLSDHITTPLCFADISPSLFEETHIFDNGESGEQDKNGEVRHRDTTDIRDKSRRHLTRQVRHMRVSKCLLNINKVLNKAIKETSTYVSFDETHGEVRGEVRQISKKKRDIRGDTCGEVRHMCLDKKKDLSEKTSSVVIGVNTFPSSLVAKNIPKGIPFWADINGWVLSEAQVQAKSMNSDAYIPRAVSLEKQILMRADKISVVSVPQKFVTLGELGILGQLRGDTTRHRRVEVVENACLTNSIKPLHANIFRGDIIPKDSVSLVHIGGFNAWSDEETLFLALEKCFEKNPQLHFLYTGGILPGIEEEQFPRFQKRIRDSRFSNRYHPLGWLPPHDLSQLLYESNIGIMTDYLCAETEIGARNRINEMLRHKLPIITTAGSDISTIIGAEGAGLVCASGDATDIADKILTLAHSPEQRIRLQEAGRRLIESRFSATITQHPLREWLMSSPCCLPRQQHSFFVPRIVSAGLLYLRQKGTSSFLRKCFQILFAHTRR